MAESYSICDQIQELEPDISASQDGREVIRHFPAGAPLEMKTLSCEDILLSGWVGLGTPHSFAGDLIGVLLPGDRLGPVLDGRLCNAIALTPVSIILEEYGSDRPREFRHLIRQCVRTCHFNAADRVEDFLWETYERLEAVELACDLTFDLPLSQATLGKILGLSTAHVNRIVKQLQSEDRIRVEGRAVTLRNLKQ